MKTTRRQFLEVLGATTAVLVVPTGCSSSATAFFSDAERRALAALSDVVLPPDQDPGGAALGAVEYIERLLTAFDRDPPLIFAGGPSSGRQPFSDGAGAVGTTTPDNQFARFLPLDRVSERAWRLYLYGSVGVPGGGPNDVALGPVVGLRDTVRGGLQKAMRASTAPLESLSPEARVLAFRAAGAGFRDTVIALVSEAAFAAPEYGGNRGGAGWKVAHYEGDSQPLGYSLFDERSGIYRERPDAPMSTANPGVDPAPIDDATRPFIALVVAAVGGQVLR